MSRKPVPAQSGERSRVEVTFDKPQLLPQLFGEYDSNILALEERLGVYIHARGQRVVIEGSAETVAHAREVLQELHARVIRGEDIDTGLIEAVIAMSSEPVFTMRHDGTTLATFGAFGCAVDRISTRTFGPVMVCVGR